MFKGCHHLLSKWPVPFLGWGSVKKEKRKEGEEEKERERERSRRETIQSQYGTRKYATHTLEKMAYYSHQVLLYIKEMDLKWFPENTDTQPHSHTDTDTGYSCTSRRYAQGFLYSVERLLVLHRFCNVSSCHGLVKQAERGRHEVAAATSNPTGCTIPNKI